MEPTSSFHSVVVVNYKPFLTSGAESDCCYQMTMPMSKLICSHYSAVIVNFKALVTSRAADIPTAGASLGCRNDAHLW